MDVGDLVAATLEGQDSRFVERCDRAAILSAIENHGIYDVDGLLAVLNDEASLPGLRAGIGAAAPPVFLTFMKRVAASRQSAPESPSHARTDERAGFSTPATSTRAGEGPGEASTEAQAPLSQAEAVRPLLKADHRCASMVHGSRCVSAASARVGAPWHGLNC